MATLKLMESMSCVIVHKICEYVGVINKVWARLTKRVHVLENCAHNVIGNRQYNLLKGGHE